MNLNQPMNITVRKNVLAAMLDIAAKKDIRSCLNGIYADPTGALVASDGMMMAMLAIDPFESPCIDPNVGVLIPRDALERAVKNCTKSGYVAIRGDGIHVFKYDWQTEDGAVIPYSPPVDGRFPPWRSIFPTRQDLVGEERSFNELQFQAKFVAKAATFIEVVTGSEFPLIYGLPKTEKNTLAGCVVHASGDDRAAVIIMPLREKASKEGVLPVIEHINPIDVEEKAAA